MQYSDRFLDAIVKLATSYIQERMQKVEIIEYRNVHYDFGGNVGMIRELQLILIGPGMSFHLTYYNGFDNENYDKNIKVHMDSHNQIPRVIYSFCEYGGDYISEAYEDAEEAAEEAAVSALKDVDWLGLFKHLWYLFDNATLTMDL